ncbi:MAG: hypothetical protein WCP69_12425 [Bacteroidota bacterium]
MKKFILMLVFAFLCKVGMCQYPVFNYVNKYFYRNDTIFSYKVYPEEGKIDSLVLNGVNTRLSKRNCLFGKRYVCKYVKYRKLRRSKWYKNNIDKLSAFEFECKNYYWVAQTQDGGKIIYRSFWFFSNVKKIPPPAS